MTAAAYATEDFQFACKLSELADDTVKGVEIDGVPLCVAKTQGTVYAISDICSHADVNLSDGDVEDGTVECWLHGSRFDLVTGKPKSLPATQPVHVFQTRIDGDDVFVALGDKDS